MLIADFAYRDARLLRVQFTSINVSLTRGRSHVEFLPRNYHFLTLYNPTSSPQWFGLVAKARLVRAIDGFFVCFFRRHLGH
jgi:hypothetical protein